MKQLNVKFAANIPTMQPAQPPKRWYQSTKLQGNTIQKTVIVTATAVENLKSNMPVLTTSEKISKLPPNRKCPCLEHTVTMGLALR
jgi:hypothetical protein